MARSVGTSIENNFVNGLITEASGLNFPENAVTDTLNCTFDERGLVHRRLGFDLENSYSPISQDINGCVVSEFLWESVEGNGDVTILVQQLGTKLHFFRVDGQGLISKNYLGVIDVMPYAFNSTEAVRQTYFQFTVGYGKLFVVSRYTSPIYIAYGADTNSLAVTTINIETRDMAGIPEGDNNRSGVLTDVRRYNLRNQGWSDNFINLFFNGYSLAGVGVQGLGIYPSNYDVWWLFKDAEEVFRPLLGATIDRGNSPAPKGSVVLQEFNQDRGGTIGVGGIPVTSSGVERPTCTEFFAGRVFYSGVQVAGFNNKIYFSQIVEHPSQYGKCYQVNDPSSEFASDLLASDGGVISIPDAGSIMRLWALDSSLIVFAANGIWAITGSNGIGFAANDYSIKKISAIQTPSANSFVSVNGFPMWWSDDDIYVVSVDPQIGSTKVSSVSNDKIKEYLRGISPEAKKYVKGAFNQKERIVQWLFRFDAPTTTTTAYSFTHILNYNVTSGAFYPWHNASPLRFLTGIFCVNGSGSLSSDEIVFDQNGETITDSGFETVTVSQTSDLLAVDSKFKYVINLNPANNLVSYAEEYSSTYTDFPSLPEAAEYESYFITGYKLRGEATRKFQQNYLTVFSDGSTDSAFYIQGIWDYAKSGSEGRWTSRQLIEHYEGNSSYYRRRLKIRGHGIALQFKINSYPGKDFRLIGWAGYESVNASP